MALDITIGGVSYASGPGYEIPYKTFSIDEDPANSYAGCQFDLIIHDNGAGAPSIARPRGGHDVVVLNGAVREFAGKIIGPIDCRVHQGMPSVMRYRVKVGDYRRYFNRHVIIDEFPPETVASRIQRIVSFVNAYAPPTFTTNGVALSVNPTLPGRRYNGIHPFTALKQAADEISHAVWLDPSFDLHLTQGLSSPSPVPGNLLLPDTMADGTISDLDMTDDPSQLITRVYAKGFAITSQEIITDTFPSGTQRGQLAREPAHPITKYVTITGGGSPFGWIVRRETVDGDSTVVRNDYSAYIHQRDRSIRFDPATTASVTVTYNPTIRPIWMVEDPVAQQDQAALDGSDGIFEAILHEPHMTGETLELADARGRMLLAKYSYPKLGGSFNSLVQGWKAGQSFLMSSAYFMGGFTNQTFYVNHVRRELYAPWGSNPVWKFEITFADRPFLF